jgi:pyruvate formate lyase activating enzyme
MSHSLSGSRYELHVTHQGTDEQKQHAYYEVLPGDVDEAEAAAELTGYVHSWEVGSTVDGPGLRFVAFLTGCLLRCQYCHNPDTWHKLERPSGHGRPGDA